VVATSFNMPQISSTKDGGMIRWDGDDWLSGLIPSWGLNTTTTLGQKGFTTSTGIDPFRRVGYLSPGASPLSATTNSVIDAMQKNGVVYLTNAYTVGGTKMHELAILTTTLTNAGSFPYTATPHGAHSALAMSDIILYYIGSTRYAFYSWNDNTDGDVGRYNLAATFDDDWMSTVPASGAVQSTINPHPMIVGADDILYIANGRFLNALDGQTGANGTYSAARLTLPTDSIITSFAKTGDNLVIFAYKAAATSSGSYYKGECNAYFWDYSSEDPYKVVPLQGNYVNGGFSFNGTIGCFLQGANATITGTKQSKLMLYNGSYFEPKIGFINNIPGHGGVEVYDNTIYWNSDGNIYQYGAPHFGLNSALNRISLLGGTTGEGMLKNFSNDRMVGSAGTTSSGGMQRVNSGNYAGTCITATVDIPMQQSKQARIKSAKVTWFSQKSTGSNKITITVYTDRATNNFKIIDTSGHVGDDRQTPPASLVNVWYDTYEAKAFPTATALALSIVWTNVDSTLTPAIPEAIEIYYEYENI
jgi:hypothetical protein